MMSIGLRDSTLEEIATKHLPMFFEAHARGNEPLHVYQSLNNYIINVPDITDRLRQAAADLSGRPRQYLLLTIGYGMIIELQPQGDLTQQVNYACRKYPSGACVTLIAHPSASQFVFHNWTGDVPHGYQEANPIQIVMDSNKLIQAHYRQA